MAEPKTAEAKLLAQRRNKLEELREQGWRYPNDFRRSHMTAEIRDAYGNYEGEEFPQEDIFLAGRLRSCRAMGKSSFAHLQDGSGRLQLMVRRDLVGDEPYRAFGSMDLGDILGVCGRLMRTKTGELTLEVSKLQMLCKSLRPLPEKYHGLTDIEQRYRQRYVDLIVNDEARRLFTDRVALIRNLREQLHGKGFLEVETPMMMPVASGAAARPFQTHHNALDQDLFLRVAPELHLKRLVVGGFEKVFELNRCFRNEGVSARHNPEFTMLEMYQAYADHRDMMNLAEALIREAVQEVLGDTRIPCGDGMIDLAKPFERMTMRDALRRHYPALDDAAWSDRATLERLLHEERQDIDPERGIGGLLSDLFEAAVESTLHKPTFIVEYPLEVSPLARRCDEDPEWTDRFELFAAGQELANGFSELNDPEDQEERFRHQAQLRQGGDDEAMPLDPDYIRAMEYGLPPTAGMGIGIDRLVMFLCCTASIRDVLLFPYMRPEAS